MKDLRNEVFLPKQINVDWQHFGNGAKQISQKVHKSKLKDI